MTKASKYFQKAADQGHEEVQAQLDVLEQYEIKKSFADMLERLRV